MAPKTIPLDELVQVLRSHAQLHNDHAFSMFLEAAAQCMEIQDQLLASYAKHIGATQGNLTDNYKIALQEWLDKTEWVQKTCENHELGMHRADVLKQRIENLQRELAEKPKLRGEYVAARKALNARYLEYVNNYITIERFAENNGLTTDQGQRLIDLAREIHNSPHPES